MLRVLGLLSSRLGFLWVEEHLTHARAYDRHLINGNHQERNKVRPFCTWNCLIRCHMDFGVYSFQIEMERIWSNESKSLETIGQIFWHCFKKPRTHCWHLHTGRFLFLCF
jgi:hypothetical protein